MCDNNVTGVGTVAPDLPPQQVLPQQTPPQQVPPQQVPPQQAPPQQTPPQQVLPQQAPPQQVPPQQGPVSFPTTKYMPSDFSHVGQARILKSTFADKLLYSDSTGWLVYNGSYFEPNMEPLARGCVHRLTDWQLQEARAVAKQCAALEDQRSQLTADEEAKLDNLSKQVRDYFGHIAKCRNSSGITGALRESQSLFLIDPDMLDADPYLLNTPHGTVDLATGAMNPHRASDLITKQTEFSPSSDGMDIWLDALDTFFCRDDDLISYVQQVVGLTAIGKVMHEFLLIAYGGGRNGKSTFWNAIAQVLGTYSGNLSAEALMVTKQNIQPEMAELQGKRLVIASELAEGMRLNTAKVKQLCSTDRIYAAKKYLQPVSFTPSHTLILCTNHLPKVGSIDQGTWRRLVVVPFSATITGNSDIKNYCEFLCKNAGEAILQWIIDGAKIVIHNDYQLTLPAVVKSAINAYEMEQDWLNNFLDECCDIDATYTVSSGEVYQKYRDYCDSIGEYTRSTSDFYAALDLKGFSRKRTRNGSIIHGFRLRLDHATTAAAITGITGIANSG